MADVTDYMVERACIAYNSWVGMGDRRKKANPKAMREALEIALSHAAGQEVVAWVVIDRDVGNTVNAVLPDQEEWAKRIASKDAHYFAAPAYLHPAVARSEGEES